MRTDTRARPAAPVDAGRDPTRAAALRRLHSASAPAGIPSSASPASASLVSTPPVTALPGAASLDAASAIPPEPPPVIAQPALSVVPWAESDPDGVRPERIAPADPDLAAWADPPWWRRVRWAPDRLAGAALVVLVVALGAFSVHRLVSAVPESVPVPELPLATPGVTATAGQAVAPEATGTNPPPPPGDATGGDAPVVVSVVGLVGRSGLVTLAPGARVADALDHAGGVLDGGDRDGLNLARKVVDGEQILVGVAPGPDGSGGPRSNIVGADAVGAVGADPQAGGAPSAAGQAGAGGAPGPAGLVNLNTADAAALDALPGVGPVTAASILAWRAANGSFGSVDQLAEVDGIGPATLARLRPLVTV